MDQNPPKEGRSPVNLRIKFRSESLEQFIERYAIDVSRGGIFIRTREPLVVGTQLKLDFQYQSGGPLMAGDGTVVWIRDPDPARPNIPPGMGVRFDRLTPESQAVLELLLADKAAREKSGLSQVVSPPSGAGGMAVRRPSSMFAALEPQGPGKASAPIAFPTQAPPRGGAAGPPPKGGPVTSILIVPIEAKSLGALSASLPLPGRGEVAPRTAATAPPTAEPAPTTPASPAPETANAGYRPLGTARNPFSGPQGLAKLASTAVPTQPVAPRPAAGGDLAKLGRGPSDDSRRRQADADAPDDDINEEPTQIAGRVPAFLLTDEDPTSIGTDPTAPEKVHRAAEERGERGEKERRASAEAVTAGPVDVAPARADAPSDDSSPTFRRPVAAPEPRFMGSLQALVSDLSKTKQSLDLAPPVGDQEPVLPSGGLARVTEVLPEPVTPSGKVAVSRRNDALLLAAAATEVRPGTRRSRSGALVGGTVVVLGAVAIFAFKFFASHQEVPAPGPTPSVAATVAPGEPAVAIANPPAIPAAAPATGTAAVAPAPAGDVPAPTPPKEVAAVAEPAPAEPAPTAKASAPAAAAEKAPSAPAEEPTKPSATAEPEPSNANPKKVGGKHKGGRATHDTDSGPAKGTSAADATMALGGGPTQKASGDAHADAAPTGHQLRVTSKPSGADVTIDGQIVGQTPLAAGIGDVSSPHFVSVHKDGYEPFEQMISASSAWAKGRATKGQPAIPTLKLNAKLKSTSSAPADAKPATGEAAPAKEGAAPAKEAAPPAKEVAAAPAKKETAPAKEAAPPGKTEEPHDRPPSPSDDRLPPSTTP